MHSSLYQYVWQTTREQQFRVCALSLMVAPLSMAPLELQRRIVDQALTDKILSELLLLASAYLVVILVQGGMKFLLNLAKGRVLETVARDLRERVVRLQFSSNAERIADQGTLVSIVAAEVEDIAEFSSDSLALPLLQGSTIVWVLGYMIWVEPEIAILAIIVYAIQPFLVFRIQGKINELARNRISLVRRLGKKVVDNLGHSEDENELTRQKAHELIGRIFQIRISTYNHKYFLTFLGNFLDALGPLVILTAGGIYLINGQTNVSTLVVFISGFQRISDPWDMLINFYRSISNARVSYRLVSDVIDRGERMRSDD